MGFSLRDIAPPPPPANYYNADSEGMTQDGHTNIHKDKDGGITVTTLDSTGKNINQQHYSAEELANGAVEVDLGEGNNTVSFSGESDGPSAKYSIHGEWNQASRPHDFPGPGGAGGGDTENNSADGNAGGDGSWAAQGQALQSTCAYPCSMVSIVRPDPICT